MEKLGIEKFKESKLDDLKLVQGGKRQLDEPGTPTTWYYPGGCMSETGPDIMLECGYWYEC